MPDESYVLPFPNGLSVENILKKAQADYTRAQIDELLAAKQAKLTSAQQSAVDSGINAAEVAQIGTNANAITSLQQSFEGLVYGYSLTAAIDSSYKITVTLKDQSGNVLSTTPAIDLPLETMVVGGSYDSTNKKIILTLDNGNTVDIPVGDLVSGLQTEITSSNKLSSDLVTDNNNSNKFVSATQKTKIDDSIDTAGSGLTVENGTGLHKSLKHTDSITAKTSVELLKIKFNSTGHITGVETATMSDMLMTGYMKSSSSDPLPIATTDTASEAIGKLEQQAGLNKNNISYIAKNNVINIFTRQTGTYSHNGVTFTTNADGSITLANTATGGAAVLTLSSSLDTTDDTYILYGDGFISGVYMDTFETGYANRREFTTYVETTTNTKIWRIVVDENTNVNGVTLRPMMCKKSLFDNNYHQYAMSNEQITAWIIAHS